MGMLGLSMEPVNLKDALSSASMERGAQCVMILGLAAMQE